MEPIQVEGEASSELFCCGARVRSSLSVDVGWSPELPEFGVKRTCREPHGIAIEP
jgi:hypothetical protein